MNLLLDTHVWVWTQELSTGLGARARALIGDRDNSLAVATVSTLEIARLIESDRISLEGTLQSWIRDTLTALRARTIELSHEVAALAYALPGRFHRDPADRVFVATAMHEGLTVLTGDRRILDYRRVSSVDARK